MNLFHLGPAGDTFAGALGVVTALLLLGGPILLRWQRNRQQFALMQAALAQGVTSFPKGPPSWLLSLRQGVLTLTAGVGLLVVGGTANYLTLALTAPATAGNLTAAVSTQPVSPVVAPSPEAGPALLAFTRPAPPPPNPALEEWHRLKSINSLSIAAIATGFVLTLLGIARIVLARTERRYVADDGL